MCSLLALWDDSMLRNFILYYIFDTAIKFQGYLITNRGHCSWELTDIYSRGTPPKRGSKTRSEGPMLGSLKYNARILKLFFAQWFSTLIESKGKKYTSCTLKLKFFFLRFLNVLNFFMHYTWRYRLNILHRFLINIKRTPRKFCTWVILR